MGLFITGSLLPLKVTPEQWSSVYDEALTLVEAYDFLDIVSDKERFKKYGKVWHYCVKTQEGEDEGVPGINIYGALKGCIRAEHQFLAKDLGFYIRNRKPDPEEQPGSDALLGALYEYGELEEYDDYERKVFGNKTQGYAHHNYLLAIALLLEDRLGKAFTVYGDITRGQIKYAVEWANKHLSRPISMPCRTDNNLLLERLSASVPREILLKSFMCLTYSSVDEALNEFLQKNFSEAEILDYWTEKLSNCSPQTIGSSRFFEEYFDMSADLKLLSKICATKFTIEEFAKELAQARVFEEEKNASNPAEALSASSDRETPETIEVAMGKIFGFMGGLSNSAVKRYIPLEQGIKELEEGINAFGDTDIHGIKLEKLIKDSIEEQASNSKQKTEVLEAFEKYSEVITERVEKCDIYDAEDLVFYEAGDTLHESLEKNLKDIRGFVDSHREGIISEFIKIYEKDEEEDRVYMRMLAICTQCRHLLTKDVWDLFEQNIEDDEFFFTLFTLLALKADTLPLSHYVKALLNNPALFDKILR